jgi:pilus assembly protein TadC
VSQVRTVVLCVSVVLACAVRPWMATRRLHRIGRAVRPTARREAALLRAQAVVATDLLAVCLAAGANPIRAAEAAAQVLDGPVGGALREAVRAAASGAGPEECWSRLAAIPDLEGVGGLLARAAVSGTRAAGAMVAEAAAMRRQNSVIAQAAVSRVGVWAVAPLALCFLPAFLCLGVAPIAVGLAPSLIG